jgi:hypothetical protein
LHASATSHTPLAARQVVPAARPVHGPALPQPGIVVSTGQAPLAPVQTSATSQESTAARHVAPAGAKPLATQTGLPLVHSIVPTSHTLPVAQATPGVHVAERHEPLTSQVPAGHAAPTAANASAGQRSLAPSQTSATSHSPAAERQTAPALRPVHGPALGASVPASALGASVPASALGASVPASAGRSSPTGTSSSQPGA